MTKLAFYLSLALSTISVDSFAQSQQKVETTEALECTSQELADCKKITVTNLIIHNLSGFEPVKVTFDVDGQQHVSLPFQPGKEFSECKRYDLPGRSQEDVIQEKDYYVSKRKISWSRILGKPSEYTVIENIDFSVGFLDRAKSQAIIEYLHQTSCSPSNPEAVKYRILGNMM